MVWSGFRPSDDAQVYGYNTAVNMYVVGAVVRALKLNDVYWKQPRFAKLGRDLCRTIRCRCLQAQSLGIPYSFQPISWVCARRPSLSDCYPVV